MLSRGSYLRSPKEKPGGRQAYQKRIDSIQRASPSASLGDEASSGQRVPDSPVQRKKSRQFSFAIRTFYRWFVRFALIALLVLLATLILFIWSPSSHPGTAAVKVEVETRMTAKNAHKLAESIALEWAEDAQLISLSATWDAGQKFQSGEGDWSLLYYSRSKASTASISVYQGQATMIDTHGVSRAVEAPRDTTWLIDSEKAVDLLKAAGGDEFLRAQPEATVSMSLDFAQNVAWRVRFIDQMSRRIFSATVNIDDGEISDVQQSG